MKQSPLQLKFVTYPTASYEVVEDYVGDGDDVVPTKVDCEVSWTLDGPHMVMVNIKSDHEEADAPYRFSVTAASIFSFDREIAEREYKPKTASQLARYIAVNAARIVYAGAREQLAMMTARGPHGAAMLKSVLLEPSDVQVRSDAHPLEILRSVFGAGQEELDELETRASAGKREEAS
ncbi:hypothetical protein [Pseudoxanthomonas mexicana]